VTQQGFDRSVLESKEREELFTIANALGVKVPSRTKKADIITAIVDATAAANGDVPEPGAPGASGAAPEGGASADIAQVVEVAEGPSVAGSPEPKTKRVRSTRSKKDGDTLAEAVSEAPDLFGMLPEPASGGAAGGETGAVVTPADPQPTVESPGATPTDSASKYRFAPLPRAPTPAGPAAPSAPTSRPGGSGNGAIAAEVTPSELESVPGDVERPSEVVSRAAPSSSPASGEGESDGHFGEGDSSDDDSGEGDSGDEGAGETGGDGGARREWDDATREGRRRRRRRGRDRDDRGVARPGDPVVGGADRPDRGERQEYPPREREAEPAEVIEVSGILEIREEGYGFLRTTGVLPSKRDVYVSASQVRRFGLRKGDYLHGATRPPSSNEKYPALLRVDLINDMTPEDSRNRPEFESLTPLFPDTLLKLERPGEPDNMTGRIIDLISPIGKGQRGLIVSPPKAGKTTVMKQIVHAIERNNPEVHLMVVLVDERPEEVTDMRRHVLKGEVVASTFDRPAEEHIQVAELTIERAKRLVELGRDVVIVLDGITRLARAYNLGAPATGRIMSGGVDSGALYPPKKFFGAARNIEEGGSLTILATALVETGSRMDEVIFEEFKGTGNMELRLDRRMAERRVYPAIDVDASSTRHEELLFERRQLPQVWKLRRVLGALADGGGGAGLEMLIDRLKTFRSNDEFLAEIAKAPSGGV
jgi:transcription termination factor Rho